MTEDELRAIPVSIMQSWVGIKAGTQGHKEIVDEYNKILPHPRGHKLTYTESWCAGTVSAAGNRANLLEIMPAECSCNNLIKLYKGIGRWVEDDTHIPKPGDLTIYDWEDGKDYASTDNEGRADHVGMVEKVENGYIVVIEGNCANKVARRNLKINGRYIRGFCCPDYAGYAKKLTEMEDENMSGEEIYAKLMEYLLSQKPPAWVEQQGEYAEAIRQGITDGSDPTRLTTRYETAIMVKRGVEIAKGER